ncbi:galactokinase [Paenibacillus silvae]|uniref:galactokinase n=1 Tax=Paenibacillus silvae TaxID=1325358 RepID=UPI002005F002|nr:galactokinase [Paenibacillus silvae]MCK6074990.1 galactokinase [Paenibacillus silvae]MCK6149377.1 galactokinase [Paenibacillus silvae]MCK6267676.1 galactokinase [Paenibacillus silvae]
MKSTELQQKFIERYGESGADIRVFHAPGRVNLIGEHIDYNGGYVLPAALEFGTTLLIRERTDHKLNLASTNMTYEGTLDTASIGQEKTGEWTDYPVGVMVELEGKGVKVTKGYDFLYDGEIPNGAGLSSSASLEVLTGYAVQAMEGISEIDTVELALLSQKAENEFVGVNCGIMDQFAVANGAKDHAILLMCDTLEYEKVPFRTGAYKLIIGNTNKRRGLVDSAYNERRSQCEQALAILKEQLPALNYLAQLKPEQFVTLQDQIKDEKVRQRAEHVVEENARVLASVEALRNNDLEAFGQLMNASHDSLRDLYEVSCTELDVMVEEARRIPGTLGARMTGAGFGGCTVSLVHENDVERFVSEVGAAYEARTGLQGDFYVCGVGEGVNELKEAK